MQEFASHFDRPEPPPMVRGFEQLQRFWEPDTQRWTVKILPGEYYVTRADEAITTVLGSCISACIRDPVVNVGGMNHFMLPEDNAVRAPGSKEPPVLATRYGSHAMESLINDLLKLGARRGRLEIKIFGGGRVLAAMTDIGARNIEFVKSYLALERLPIDAQDVGGEQPRKVIYFPSDGKVKVRKLRPIENRGISDRERLYMDSLRAKEDGGDIELFT
ncbi:MAG TPA: chemoreceptor glutamine deamidase CheD [Steroidobacteraceae bacterium]|jgi:chemotaxis protein CheD|nr:chemoreceptor glutamine deamidase CheD [Steroidobacteraceae bacterium]